MIYEKKTDIRNYQITIIVSKSRNIIKNKYKILIRQTIKIVSQKIIYIFMFFYLI